MGKELSKKMKNLAQELKFEEAARVRNQLQALEKVMDKSSDKRDLEHVTYYIYNHPYDFNLSFLNVPPELERDDVRLTIDIKEDFEICREILNHFFRNNIEMNYKNILNYIDNNPLLLERMKYNIKHAK